MGFSAHVILALCIFLAVSTYLMLNAAFKIPKHIQNLPDMIRKDPTLGLTLRVNTFRRNDLLEGFLSELSRIL